MEPTGPPACRVRGRCRRLLAAQAAFAVAVVGEAAADAVGADARQPEAGPVTTSAAAAQRLEAHAAVAVRVAALGSGEVAHRVPAPLSRATPNTLLCPVPPPSALSRPVCGDQRLVIGPALGARVAARSGACCRPCLRGPCAVPRPFPDRAAPWLTFAAPPPSVWSGLGVAARTISGRGLIMLGSPRHLRPAAQCRSRTSVRRSSAAAATLATSTPFQSVCSPPTRATP